MYLTIDMTNLRYIKILFFWCIAMSALKAQANNCLEVKDTLSPKIFYQESASMPSTFCQGQQIDLSSEDGSILHWEVSNGLIFNGSQFSFTLDVPGTYQIKVEDNSSCNCSLPAYYISDYCDNIAHLWDLIIRHTGTDDHLYSANIFSPNDDGVND